MAGCVVHDSSLLVFSMRIFSYMKITTRRSCLAQEKFPFRGKVALCSLAGDAMVESFDFVRFGERLREVRSKRKLTLKDVHESTKVSVPTLSRIERGESRELESKTLFALSSWAGLNLDLFQSSPSARKRSAQADIPTPDVVELHLRADKNLNPKTAELLVRMFRAAYEQAAAEL
jgi:transcriptional regulator with XRE-family HTH domain